MKPKSKPPNKRTLDPEVAEKVLLADVGNILAKAKSGRPLSKYERDLIARSQTSTPAPCTPASPAEHPTYYDSIANAAARLKIPAASLRRAKKRGAPGFRGSRVYPGELLPWLQAQEQTAPRATAGAADEKEVLELRRLRGAIEREEFDFQVARAEWTKNAILVTALQKLCSDTKALLRQKLESEYPTTVTSMEPAAARVYGKRLVDAICKELARFADRWKF